MASTFTSMTARSTATSSGSARNSRRSTASSRRSKRSMASAIDTATAYPAPRLAEPTRTRPRLFDLEGKSVADSRFLRGPGDAIQVTELPPLDDDGLIGRLAERVYRWVTGLMPQRGGYPPYHEVAGGTAENYPEVMQALHGESASAVRSDPQ